MNCETIIFLVLLCHYNGTDHKPGSSYPSTDGCNTCTCSDSGFTSCTEMACNKGKQTESQINTILYT